LCSLYLKLRLSAIRPPMAGNNRKGVQGDFSPCYNAKLLQKKTLSCRSFGHLAVYR
jgi:hypothetical protein